jgi:site-specific recombinase
VSGLTALEAQPSPNELIARYATTLGAREVRDLVRWLGEGREPFALLESALEWLFRGGAEIGGEAGGTVRLRVLVEVLEAAPAWRSSFAAAMTTALVGSTVLSLLESGLPNQRGLFEETADRLARRLLPTPRDPRDLADVIVRAVRRRKRARWIVTAPDAVLARLDVLLRSGGHDPWPAARRAYADAVLLVTTRTAALGLTREIQPREAGASIASSPFCMLSRLGHQPGSTADWADAIAGCRRVIDGVLARLEDAGVSVDVVYRIEVIGKNLTRLEELLAVRDGAPGAVARLVGRAIDARFEERGLREILRTNTHLMARKIIERAGRTGEHYITTTRREYRKMLASAAGGGFLTAGTTLVKFMVAWGHFPLFVEGFLASSNYALSFVIMQLVGFTLATKQPSMTAAALAGALHAKGRDTELDDLVTVIARICRSQLAAALGNITMVVPTVLCIHLIYARVTGHAFLDVQSAEHTLHSLHPTHTGTIPFAALTGVFLWLSSLCAGWLENWSAYRRLPDGVAEHRLGKLVGRAPMRWLGRAFAHQIAGLGGNVSLGFLLGMMPVCGKFLGVPLEVRHVTLSTGALTLAMCTLGKGAVHHGSFWAAAAGIAIIAVLNFGVSFALALKVALRARGVEHAGLRLLRAVARRWLRAPLEFLVPPS